MKEWATRKPQWPKPFDSVYETALHFAEGAENYPLAPGGWEIDIERDGMTMWPKQPINGNDGDVHKFGPEFGMVGEAGSVSASGFVRGKPIDYALALANRVDVPSDKYGPENIDGKGGK